MPLLPRLRPHAGEPLGSCGAVEAGWFEFVNGCAEVLGGVGLPLGSCGGVVGSSGRDEECGRWNGGTFDAIFLVTC